MSDSKSLQDVHESVDVTQKQSKIKKILSFFGPAYLISVGYMDPGNWATDLAGGSQFGYALLWVLVMSNLMALLLQSLCTRLGIVVGKDLAQCNRETYPKGMNFVLYILAEVAIAACDLAEIIGMAIGLQLLFGLDLIWGVSISFLDTFLLLYLQKLGMRKMELFIISLIFLIGICFFAEMVIVKPDIREVAKGFIPSIPNSTALYIAIGMIGATVMPHNLYLHSALVQTRKINRDEASIRKSLKYNFWDTTIALNLAFLVNAAILILAATAFHKTGQTGVAELEDAHKLLAPTLGTDWASKLFAIALIAAGQSSTITGTLAGQIVMEGYLRLRINPMLRRMITRLIAIVPAVLVILIVGEKGVGKLLIFSQVLLSLQLAFAVIPLIHFVSDKVKMGVFAIKLPTKILAWIIAAVVSILNFKLVFDQINIWISGSNNWILNTLLIAGGIGLIVLLFMTIIYPYVYKRKTVSPDVMHAAIDFESINPAASFDIIALALDFSKVDIKVLEYALSIAQNKSTFILIHIVESPVTQLNGVETQDLETKEDIEKLNEYSAFFKSKGFEIYAELGYNNRVKSIKEICDKYKAQLLIVGSHGHVGVKDFIYGETANKLRHEVKIPVFIAQ